MFMSMASSAKKSVVIWLYCQSSWICPTNAIQAHQCVLWRQTGRHLRIYRGRWRRHALVPIGARQLIVRASRFCLSCQLLNFLPWGLPMKGFKKIGTSNKADAPRHGKSSQSQNCPSCICNWHLAIHSYRYPGLPGPTRESVSKLCYVATTNGRCTTSVSTGR